jgi:hypothetical protein
MRSARHDLQNHVVVVALNRACRDSVRLQLAAPRAAMNDLEGATLADEFNGLHQSEALGHTITRPSFIDMHRP